MTTTEAAAALGVSRQRIHALIKTGRLRAAKHGRDYWIEPCDLEKVAVRVNGWPRGRKRGPRKARLGTQD